MLLSEKGLPIHEEMEAKRRVVLSQQSLLLMLLKGGMENRDEGGGGEKTLKSVSEDRVSFYLG